MKHAKCDQCGRHWTPGCYAEVVVRAPGGPEASTFDICKPCLQKGVLVREAQPTKDATNGKPN